MSQPALIQVPQSSQIGYQAYGAAAEFWRCREPEILLDGPYETGKTFGALHKLNALLCKYPGARALMVRKTYKSLVSTAVPTYENKVLAIRPDDPRSPIQKLGKSMPQLYTYPNGSTITLGGMDNPQKVLSGEYDFAFVPQLEELTLNEYEHLTSRVTGRAGNAPYPQVLADCNPDVPTHWIPSRRRLRRFKSKHEDNPTLWDAANGRWTPQGERTMATLRALTGVRYKRGYLGLWAGREGQVYEFDPLVHLIDRFDIPRHWRLYRCIDFGYTNPFVCQWWAMDDDGRLYRYREIYMSQRTVREHAELINKLSEGENYTATIADHDAEDRATLHENGIHTQAADKRISVGIEKVQERLKTASDGKPRLFLLRDSTIEVDVSLKESHRPTSTEEEFPGYVWPERRAARAADERPIKCDDHGMDAIRYMVMEADGKNNIDYASISTLGTVKGHKSRWR